ncbi:MAG: hypothetical protein KDE51_15005 [Anaerolineales bacterium]|nr:hypothetical protein [Anaerolineales bacterium]
MKRLLLATAVLLLFLVGCGAPPAPEAAAVDTEESEPVAVEAPPTTDEEAPQTADSAETEEASGGMSTQVVTTNINNLAALETAAVTIQDAAVLRENYDWVKGASEPLLAIVEYGDFQ